MQKQNKLFPTVHFNFVCIFIDLYLKIVNLKQNLYSLTFILALGYKTFSVLNSAEHEIYPAQKC